MFTLITEKKSEVWHEVFDHDNAVMGSVLGYAHFLIAFIKMRHP